MLNSFYVLNFFFVCFNLRFWFGKNQDKKIKKFIQALIYLKSVHIKD